MVKSMWKNEKSEVKETWAKIARMYTFARRHNTSDLVLQHYLTTSAEIFQLPDPSAKISYFLRENEGKDWSATS
jgi:hypothetical protein